MPMFEYAVAYKPSDAERKDGKRATILVPTKLTICKDEHAAGLEAARAIPEEYADRLENVEVAVRPFVG